MKKLREKKGAWGSGETKGGKSEVSNGWFKFRRDKEQGKKIYRRLYPWTQPNSLRRRLVCYDVLLM